MSTCTFASGFLHGLPYALEELVSSALDRDGEIPESQEVNNSSWFRYFGCQGNNEQFLKKFDRNSIMNIALRHNKTYMIY